MGLRIREFEAKKLMEREMQHIAMLKEACRPMLPNDPSDLSEEAFLYKIRAIRSQIHNDGPETKAESVCKNLKNFVNSTSVPVTGLTPQTILELL